MFLFFHSQIGSKSGFLKPLCLIMSYFFLNLRLKLYLDTCEHKSFLWVNSFLCLSWIFRGPQTLHCGSLSLYFDNFFVRKTVGSRETPRDGLFSTVVVGGRHDSSLVGEESFILKHVFSIFSLNTRMRT